MSAPLIRYPRRVPLAQFATPLEPLRRLGAWLGGPEIWVKRDDQAGLATGGNKTRKLEFVAAEALDRGCDHLVTMGGPQSNHCRQTAAAAARLGLGCSVVLGGEAPEQVLGNLLLDTLLGADLIWAGSHTRDTAAAAEMQRLSERGRTPYLIGLGASSPLGALGYTRAMAELVGQLESMQLTFDAIVLASSSGGTQAGLVLGASLYGFTGEIIGVSIDMPEQGLQRLVADIASQATALVGRPHCFDPSEISVAAGYQGAGYARVGDLERNATALLARQEGLLLDPVYTSRAMGGLIDLIAKGRFGRHQRVLFWHTGGTAALSAFSEALQPPPR